MHALENLYLRRCSNRIRSHKDFCLFFMLLDDDEMNLDHPVSTAAATVHLLLRLKTRGVFPCCVATE